MVEIVGHRGACGKAPENTLKSFEAGIASGCHRVELDVQVSADGVAVVMHDVTVDRTTDGKGRVDGMDLGALKRLDAGEGERIPTLEEVMNLCRHRVGLQIELKASSSPALVAQLIDRCWGRGDVVVTSFQLALLDEFSLLIPEIPCGVLNNKSEFDMVTIAARHGHRWICPRANIATEILVRTAHRVGLMVYAYHVNEALLAANLIRWGVDAIGTDYPLMVTALLDRQKSRRD